MTFAEHFKAAIFTTQSDFEALALAAFDYQIRNNQVYSAFVNYLGRKPKAVRTIADIPFLPIECYKYHKILSVKKAVEKVFESSGTTGSKNSKHYICSLQFYEKLCLQIFRHFYGNPQNYHILALLPSYLERSNSALVHMVKTLMLESGKGLRFYRRNYSQLRTDLKDLQADNSQIILIGVTFALLELAETKLDLSKTIIIETGGMKGYGREQVRSELHNDLTRQLNPLALHSEYGMTELLSHTYRQGQYFKALPWFKVYLRDVYDPFDYSGRRGAVNIIDLANIDSCCFIQTSDLGELKEQGDFEIVGRLDQSDLRGCNLLYQ